MDDLVLVSEVLDLIEVKDRWRAILFNENDECLEWPKSLDEDGYGEFKFRLGGRSGKYYKFRAHRVAFYYFNGRMPDNLVLHKCNNRKCCNPNHLSDGTHAENMHDRAMAETHRATKLSLGQVVKMREMYETGFYSQRDLGRLFGIAPSAVHHNLRKRVGV